MSLIVREAPGAAVGAYAACVAEIIALIEQGDQGAGHPISANQLQFRWPPAGLDLEARAGSGSLWSRKLALWGYTLVGYIAFRSGWHIGGFDPTRYRQNIAINSDYRKFDDGLRMTVDCRLETADEIERILSQAKLAHIVNYGCHRQNAAQITCIVPSINADDHMHFIDGSNGGYAIAAQKITRSPTARDY